LLVCPHCKTSHRVSVVQGAYRQLPCKSCARPMPLALAEASSAALPAAPPSSDLPPDEGPGAALWAAAHAADAEQLDGQPEPAESRSAEEETAMPWGERIRMSPPSDPALEVPVREAP